ncbi:MAG TPA: DUF2959 family protein, partial [Verrucomicrobiae bacterium]|nr:DUF2959 family protein [Verrucomicrobiae bacterium]
MHKPTNADSRKLTSVASVLVSVLGALCLVACTSTGYRRGDSVAVGMTSAAAEVQAESRALQSVVSALNSLVASTNADLKPPYRAFSSRLTRLVAAAHKTEDTGKRMTERDALYLKMWEEQLSKIDFEHIRELSGARKAEVSQHMEAVHERYQQTQQVMQPLISYLQDLHKALGADLTQAGLVSMKGIADNAGTNAARVQVALNALSAELTDSGSR